MSTLQVSNVIFESTANNRIQYVDNALCFYSSGKEVVNMDNNGYLLLGHKNSRGTCKLQVTGGAGISGATAWSNLSDERLKTNIAPITDGLDKILQLKPVQFEFKNKELHNDPRENGGFLSQDFISVFPDCVTKTSTPESPDKELLDEDGLAYDLTLTNKYHAYVVAAIQELSSKYENLKKEFEEYKITHP
jgi:hypothetical protein